MNAVTLDDFLAFNQQLVALHEAGAPLARSLVLPGQDVSAALQKVAAAVTRRVGRGETLAEALSDNEFMPSPAYLSLVQSGVSSGNLQAGLDGASRLAASADDARYDLRSALFYPLVVCCFAIAGIMTYFVFIAPRLDAFSQDLQTYAPAEDASLRPLDVGFASAAGILAAAAIVGAWFVYRRTRSSHKFQSGHGGFSGLSGSTPFYWQRCATFARTVGALIDARVPLAESLRIAAEATEDRLTAPALAAASAIEQGKPIGVDDEVVQPFPPFLRWALFNSEPAVARPKALEMAADVYTQVSERRERRARLMTPILACVFLGGGVTLLYGLALFVPVTRLLNRLAL